MSSCHSGNGLGGLGVVDVVVRGEAAEDYSGSG
jgi:hypothetical protein